MNTFTVAYKHPDGGAVTSTIIRYVEFPEQAVRRLETILGAEFDLIDVRPGDGYGETLSAEMAWRS